jgi:hypothetical protein
MIFTNDLLFLVSANVADLIRVEQMHPSVGTWDLLKIGGTKLDVQIYVLEASTMGGAIDGQGPCVGDHPIAGIPWKLRPVKYVPHRLEIMECEDFKELPIPTAQLNVDHNINVPNCTVLPCLKSCKASCPVDRDASTPTRRTASASQR